MSARESEYAPSVFYSLTKTLSYTLKTKGDCKKRTSDSDSTSKNTLL